MWAKEKWEKCVAHAKPDQSFHTLKARKKKLITFLQQNCRLSLSAVTINWHTTNNMAKTWENLQNQLFYFQNPQKSHPTACTNWTWTTTSWNWTGWSTGTTRKCFSTCKMRSQATINGSRWAFPVAETLKSRIYVFSLKRTTCSTWCWTLTHRRMANKSTGTSSRIASSSEWTTIRLRSNGNSTRATRRTSGCM